jgi:RNA polymerase sigma-70 factor (ECF subfamily)
MTRYAKGEAAAFAALYDALAPRLHRFCARLSRPGPEADDLFQETMLRLHRARASYIPGAPTLPWAFAIARSAYLDRLRLRRRRPEQVAGEDEDPTAIPVGATPESDALARALLTILARELERMSEKNRSAYVLLREEGFSVAEAAAVLGTSGEAVKQRAHRADEQIREAIRAAGWSLPSTARPAEKEKMSPRHAGGVPQSKP